MADIIMAPSGDSGGSVALVVVLAAVIIGGVTWANWDRWNPNSGGPGNTEINVTSPAAAPPAKTEINLTVPESKPDTNIIVPPAQEGDTNIIVPPADDKE